MSGVLVFLFIWGVYLITPVLVDGFDSLMRLTVVQNDRSQRKGDKEPEEPDDWPTMTMIIPAHNEAAVIDRCVTSVKNQDYPSDRLEIIVVDDGSTDDTVSRVESHMNGNGVARPMRVRSQKIAVGPFAGKVALIKSDHGGKSQALNAGIAESSGEIIVNIDSDVVLAHDAARNIALTFMRHPEIDAATGNVQIDWQIIEDRDENGAIIVDDNGDIIPRELNPFERYLAQCEFLEYLASFDLGRRSQAITSTMFTLAGACTACRRTLVASGIKYSSATVSEDTALTFDLHRRGAKIGFMAGANVHVEPVTDLDSLYGQRVRWARGQLEVCALNEDLIGKRGSSIGRFSLPKMLIFDHTLAFPRLVWGPVFLCFVLIGYSWATIVFACIAMYLFYVLIEIVHVLSSYSVADDFTKSRVELCGWALLGMPIYRLIVFYYRFSGFLVTLKDEQKWTTSGPVETARRDLEQLRLRSVQVTSVFGAGMARAERFTHLFMSLPLITASLGLLMRLKDLWHNLRS